MPEHMRFVIPRHAVPADADTGLSPLQQRMLDDPTPIRIFSAPTGAGKSYAFQKGMRERGDRVLFIVPTRRLAQNLAEGLVADLIRDGASEEQVLSRVLLWTSDERQRQEQTEPDVRARDRRIRQIRSDKGVSGGGFMIVATPETVAWYLLNPRLRNDGVVPENLLDLLQLSHVVFDEFHTIEARGMGMSCALATFAWQARGTARITFLSATPIDLKTTLIGFGIPEHQIAVAQETVVTGTREETAGMRAIHGDVEVFIEQGTDLLQALDDHRAAILDTLARPDDGHQVVLVYDSVRQLLADKAALAGWFDSVGVEQCDRLAVNSSDDSVDREMDGFFTIGRRNDPRDFPVLVATSSIEMGVTFKAGLLLMEPGHDVTSFVQRIGRVARGDLPGTAIVHLTQTALDRHAWMRQLLRELPVEHGSIPIDRFTGHVLKAVHERFQVTERELRIEDGMFRRMPQSAIWAAGVFWVALESAAKYPGSRATLRSFSPPQAAVIFGLVHTLENIGLNAARQWVRAFLHEARRLRVILPKVTLVDPGGRRKALPWMLYAATEELVRAPVTHADDGSLEVHVASPIVELEQTLGGAVARRFEEVLFPHSGRTHTLELRGIRDAWIRVAENELQDPGLLGTQERALQAGIRLVRLTGIVPIVTEETAADDSSVIV